MTPSPPSAHPSGISLNHVTKNFGRKQVLTDVTAELPAGRIYGLLGSNGVGKTTLMSLICGHQFRTGGHILIDGIVGPAAHVLCARGPGLQRRLLGPGHPRRDPRLLPHLVGRDG